MDIEFYGGRGSASGSQLIKTCLMMKMILLLPSNKIQPAVTALRPIAIDTGRH